MARVEHPNLTQFERALAARSVTSVQAQSFDSWRNNPNKCAPGSDLKLAADELWQRFVKEMGGEPAKPKVQATDARPKGDSRGRASGREHGRRAGARRPTSAGRNANAASPACLGEAFHHAYTFLPFPQTEPQRDRPTPLTIDERAGDGHGDDRARFTGTVDIALTTLSPLLTCRPEPESVDDGHARHRVLAIGDDVIVPATGIRGALRSLMSIISGGTLGYVDDEVWLCQGRDAQLGPSGPKSADGVPHKPVLARVIRPGGRDRTGWVQLGTTRLERAEDLERAYGGPLDKCRPTARRKQRELWTDDAHRSVRSERDAEHPWQIKLSGRPIKRNGKREGLFRDDGPKLELPEHLWSAYNGRNRHGDHAELEAGDLVWLEPDDPAVAEITRAEQVKSIQWARWGRRGERLVDVVKTYHRHLLPDAFSPDGLVDEVTNLFGQVPRADLAGELFAWRSDPDDKRPGPAGPFAARIRPDNLVFFDAVESGVEKAVPLAPLAPPHPGCAAFYREWRGGPAELDHIANRGLPLNGVKVYRTTRASGVEAPWLFTTQGVYRENGRLYQPRQKVNKTCDLARAGQTGRLRLSCRALSARELALMLAACSVDWRLGGGKPLGLGWCRVTSARVRDENGGQVYELRRAGDEPAPLPETLAGHLREPERARLRAWHVSQLPVERLRYPRAVDENRNKKNRGGHAWFARHASPRKSGGEEPRGLETLWTDGELRERAGAPEVRAQALPPFDPDRPDADRLYGYDLFSGDRETFRSKQRDGRTFHRRLEPFHPDEHEREEDRSGDHKGQDRAGRHSRRRDRRQ